MLLAQLLYYIGAILSVPLLPVLYFQGKRVRKNIPRLPEASLNLTGIAGDGAAGTPLQLLALGESTIAGVGVHDHADGFVGHTAKFLSIHTGRPVHWQVVARSGYDAKAAYRKLVREIPGEAYDFIVIGLGGNDTFYLNGPMGFRRNIVLLIRSLREKLPPETPIVIIALPPVGAFPALPGLVRMALGALVHLHGFAIRRLPTRFPGVFFPGRPIHVSEWVSDQLTLNDLFSDGIHPSARAYQMWAEETVRFIVRKKLF